MVQGADLPKFLRSNVVQHALLGGNVEVFVSSHDDYLAAHSHHRM